MRVWFLKKVVERKKTRLLPLPGMSIAAMRLLFSSAMKMFPIRSTATPQGVFSAVPSLAILTTDPVVLPAATFTMRLFAESAT